MNWRGQLQLDGGEQKANLTIASGSIRVTDPSSCSHVLRAGAALGRFLIGSDNPIEIIRQEDITCLGEAAELATVLFPDLYPVLSHFDEF